VFEPEQLALVVADAEVVTGPSMVVSAALTLTFTRAGMPTLAAAKEGEDFDAAFAYVRQCTAGWCAGP
jgi:hypothetical protein